MFSGLVESLAPVERMLPEPPGWRLVVCEPRIAAGAGVGDSIAVSGCCLTVVAIEGQTMAFQAGPETMRCTNLSELAAGSWVNLEKSLRVGDPLGGHFVTGHVDGVGTLDLRRDAGEWSTFWFRAPQELMPQMASKGSIAVDGVSLTLVDLEEDRFSVALIPHTLSHTTLGKLRQGMRVNLETDLLAKYVCRQLQATSCRPTKPSRS